MSTFPARDEPLLFALLPSGLMLLLVSGVATWQSLGLRSDGRTVANVLAQLMADRVPRRHAHSARGAQAGCTLYSVHTGK